MYCLKERYPLLLSKNTIRGKTIIDGNTFFFTPNFKQVYAAPRKLDINLRYEINRLN